MHNEIENKDIVDTTSFDDIDKDLYYISNNFFIDNGMCHAIINKENLYYLHGSNTTFTQPSSRFLNMS